MPPDAEIEALLAREEIPWLVEFLRGVFNDPSWEAAIDEDMSAENRARIAGWLAANARGDIRWMLEHTDPEATISPPEQLPDARTYTGRAGPVEALHDWPSQWEQLRLEPIRIVEGGPSRVLLLNHQEGRGVGSGVEVGADFVFAFDYREDLLARWEMFFRLEDALAAGKR